MKEATTTSAISVHQAAGRLLLEIDRDQDGVIARWDGERFTVELDPQRAAEFLRAVEKLIPQPPPLIVSPRKDAGTIFNGRESAMLDQETTDFLERSGSPLLLIRDQNPGHHFYDLRKLNSL